MKLLKTVWLFMHSKYAKSMFYKYTMLSFYTDSIWIHVSHTMIPVKGYSSKKSSLYMSSICLWPIASRLSDMLLVRQLDKTDNRMAGMEGPLVISSAVMALHMNVWDIVMYRLKIFLYCYCWVYCAECRIPCYRRFYIIYCSILFTHSMMCITTLST